METFNAHIVPATRTEFQEWLEEIIVRQQKTVDSLLTDEDAFVISGLRKVHTIACPMNGFEKDRREAFHRIGDFGDIRSDIIHGGGPRFPDIVTRADLAAATAKYDRCQVCTPAVPSYQKRAGVPTHDQLVEYIESAADTQRGKPQRAVADILRLHTEANGSCAHDRTTWPCQTVRIIHGIWGIQDLAAAEAAEAAVQA